MFFSRQSKVRRLKEKGDVRGLLKLLFVAQDDSVVAETEQALGAMLNSQTIPLLQADKKQPNIGMRIRALEALGYCDDPEARAVLTYALKDEELLVQQAAIASLARVGDELSIAPLLKLIHWNREAVYVQVIQAVVQITERLYAPVRYASVMQPMEDVVRRLRQDHDDDVGTETLEWLGWVSPTEQAQLSEEEIRGAKRRLRVDMLKALEQMGWMPSAPDMQAEVAIWKGDWQRCVEIGTPAVEALIATFKGEKDDAVRRYAYNALVQIGSPAADQLIHALKDDFVEMRIAAFQALVKIGSKAFPELLYALQDEHRDVRRAAARGLGQIGDLRAVEPLVNGLSDIDWEVRKEAYHALMRLGKAIVPHLVALIRRPDAHNRWAVAEILDTFGWTPGMDEFGAAYWIVKGDWERCFAIGAAAIPTLIDMVGHWDRDMCKGSVNTLVRFAATHFEWVLEAFQNEPDETRRCAYRNMAMMDFPQAEQLVQELLLDEDDEGLQEEATAALEAMQKRRKQQERKERRQQQGSSYKGKVVFATVTHSSVVAGEPVKTFSSHSIDGPSTKHSRRYY